MKRKDLEKLKAAGTTVAVKTGYGQWGKSSLFGGPPPTVREAEIVELGVDRKGGFVGWGNQRTLHTNGVRVRYTGAVLYDRSAGSNGPPKVVDPKDVLDAWAPLHEREIGRASCRERVYHPV